MSTPADNEHFDVVVVGAGQAGLAVGYHLAKRGVRFVILDAGSRVGDSWRHRWDSLLLFTPARIDGLPEMPFPSSARLLPTKDAMADYLEAYAKRFKIPVRSGVVVDGLDRDDGYFLLKAGGLQIRADQVVVTTGANQVATVPPFANELDPGILQLSAAQYRNPSDLKDGDVLVVGAGVAGLQAIATSRRLGAVVEAYDVRPAVKEQVESLGAKFVELPLEAGEAEDRSGYAKAQDEDFYRRQREMMARVVAGSDAVITTAQVPGKTAPVLLTAEMVAGMAPGSVVVDIAAGQGGNCELTMPDQTVTKDGVTVLGPTNLPATVPYHASQMYAKNMSAFLAHLIKDGELRIDLEDEITRETLVSRGGQVVHPRVREAFGLAPYASEPEQVAT